ncbi:MAG TPA: PEP-CTERM sorting domain-containing protein [Micropepsaceae bacterium]|nr:PEP-CTERM sorting domain-containing protein [Micropepsaceae bacterium]
MRFTYSVLLLSMLSFPAFARTINVPEPASITVLGIGLAAMMLLRRGKKQ